MSLLLYHVLLARRGQRAEEVCLRFRPPVLHASAKLADAECPHAANRSRRVHRACTHGSSCGALHTRAARRAHAGAHTRGVEHARPASLCS